MSFTTLTMSMNFENQCNELNRFITIGPNRENMVHAKRVLQHFIDSMKLTDEVFKKIFQSSAIAGSYADDIKVSQPDEFDFLVFFKFPNFKQYTVRQSRPAHIVINADCLRQNNHKNQEVVVNKVRSMCDSNGNLSKSKIHLWVHQLLDVEFNKLAKMGNNVKKPKFLLIVEGHRYSLTRERSGPAHTFNVELLTAECGKKTNKFSIDMVPATCLDNDRWVSTARPFDHVHWNGKWHAIPKVYKNLTRGNDNEMICSFAEIERIFLHSKNKIKNLIRVFKKLRDNKKLHTLKSYHIKTVFLWKIESVNRDYWNGSMEKMFFEMFQELLTHIERKSLPFFWDRKFNLFEEWTSDQQTNLLGNFKKIHDKLTIAKQNNNWDNVLPQLLLNESELIEYANKSTSSSSGACEEFVVVNPRPIQSPTLAQLPKTPASKESTCTMQ